MSKFFSKAFEESQHRCVFCGKDMLSDFDTFMTTVEDHLKPTSIGGHDEQGNIVISCSVCNNLKGNYFPDGVNNDDRAEIISKAREYIMKRRALAMSDFMSWVTPKILG